MQELIRLFRLVNQDLNDPNKSQTVRLAAIKLLRSYVRVMIDNPGNRRIIPQLKIILDILESIIGQMERNNGKNVLELFDNIKPEIEAARKIIGNP